ncbi:MAG: ABC transporter permease [Lachnospiraceae bacterium]|jgi:ABC-2 type transport system permease protein|nr:ABC transporter permease [Lachnospiraceae bacterium]MCI9395542.1 ABC transporter permease [Lachnospiraceae bacterium]
MRAIYKRELRSYFCSFTGWLFVAVNLFVMGLYFIVYNMLMGYPTIAYVLQSIVFTFIVTIPILTMRTLSEERKNKTDQLILTAPVSVGKIVLGKYLALATVLFLPTAFMGILPLFLMQGGDFQLGVSYASLLGFFLYGCLALAVGLFLSSLTESVVIAAVLSFGALFLGYIMPGISNLLTSTGTSAVTTVIGKILSCFDMVSRFDTLSSGYFELEAVVYYLTAISLALFCTAQTIQKRRYNISGGGLKVGAYSVTGILLAIAAVVAVNLGLNYVPEQYSSFDLTENRLYALTDETKAFLSGLSEDITIYVLAEEGAGDADFSKTLERMADQSTHIKIKYVSPAKNPNFYQNYTDVQPSSGSLIVEGDRRSTVVDYGDIYTYEMDYSTYSYQTTGYDGEGQTVSALAYVTTEDMPVFYAIGGHGELELEEKFVNTITKENAACETLMLYSVDEIPEDAQGVILNAPTSDYSKEDAEKVIAYLQKGGNALIISTMAEGEMANFKSILDFYGITEVDGTIVEEDRNYYYQNPYYLFPEIVSAEVTAPLADGLVFAPFSKGLSYDEEKDDIHYTPLLTTSSSAFSKVDITDNSDYSKGANDIDGPFTVSVEVEKSTENGGVSHAYVVGGESLFTSLADDMAPGNNVKLFSSMISMLAEHESSVAVPVKSLSMPNLVFNAQTAYLAAVLCVIVIPLATLAAGLVVWLRRRRR